MSLSKGLENLLDQILVKPFIRNLILMYPNKLPNSTWRVSHSKLKRIYLKTAQGQSFNLTLGQWLRILRNYQNDILDNQMVTYLIQEGIFSDFSSLEQQLNQIIDSPNSRNFIDIRNQISHNTAISFKTLIQVRKKLVTLVNRVLRLMLT